MLFCAFHFCLARSRCRTLDHFIQTAKLNAAASYSSWAHPICGRRIHFTLTLWSIYQHFFGLGVVQQLSVTPPVIASR